MKVTALRTVYSRSQGKEFQKGQTFEASEQESRVWIKLRKVEVVAEKEEVAPAQKPPRQQQTSPRQISTSSMQAEDSAVTPTAMEPDKPPRRYFRRDLLPKE